MRLVRSPAYSRCMATLPGYLDLTFPEPPAERPYVIVNMVMSADGKIVIEGNEQGLGSPADQYLMGALRSHVDAVLNGAETLRASGSTPDPGREQLRAIRLARGLPEIPLGVILSRSGDLPLDSAFLTSERFPAVVFLADSAPAEKRAAIEATGRRVFAVSEGNAVADMLRILRRELEIRLLICEGGATLNGALFDAGAIDEYFVTVGARLVGGDVALTPIRSPRASTFEGTRRLELVSAIPNTETDEVYLRYRVGTAGVQPAS